MREKRNAYLVLFTRQSRLRYSREREYYLLAKVGFDTAENEKNLADLAAASASESGRRAPAETTGREVRGRGAV